MLAGLRYRREYIQPFGSVVTLRKDSRAGGRSKSYSRAVSAYASLLGIHPPIVVGDFNNHARRAKPEKASNQLMPWCLRIARPGQRIPRL